MSLTVKFIFGTFFHFLFLTTLFSDPITIAVASNFSHTLKKITKRFEEQTSHKSTLSIASTGKLYAQIKHGAPFDLFFAADSRRPKLLEQEKIAIAGSRTTYATGRLVLWSKKTGYVNSSGAVLKTKSFNYIAIANPKLAPYGQAAKEVLKSQGLWHQLQKKVVQGESIGQVFLFITTGNAELGFVSLSQILQLGKSLKGSYWAIPHHLYHPINQQVVLLTNNPAAKIFLAFIKNDVIKTLIKNDGY